MKGRTLSIHRQYLVACAASILMITGCAFSGETTPERVDNKAYFTETLGEARAGGASEQQIRVLETAAEAGEVTYADVAGQMEYFQACIEDAGGILLREDDRKIAPDTLAPGYAVAVPGLDDDAQLSIIEACENAHLDYVMWSLWSQPTTVAARDVEYKEALPQIIACLRDNGITVDDDAPIDEVKILQSDLGGTTGIICYEPSWY